MTYPHSDPSGLPTRRDFLRIVAVAGGAAAVGLAASTARRPAAQGITRNAVVMGTFAHLTIYSEDPGHAGGLADGALAEMSRVAALLTRFPGVPGVANVHELNEQRAVTVPTPELTAVVGAALRWAAATSGAFDPTVLPAVELAREPALAPERLEAVREAVDYRRLIAGRTIRLDRPATRVTLDGIAKGYVVDRTVAFLKDNGMQRVLVEAGGDLAAAGTRPGRGHWLVGVRDPRAPKLMMDIELDGRAVATSGDYESSPDRGYRLHHLIDPRTCAPAGGTASATVVAPTCMDADALSTAVFVLGARDGIDLLEAVHDVEGLVIDKGGRAYRTSRFPEARR